MSDYGKRGGTSPNLNRRASTYRVLLPDGTMQTKRSFQVDTPHAIAGIYQHDGIWYVAGIYPANGGVGNGQQVVLAKKIH